jgi:hypothetical protein
VRSGFVVLGCITLGFAASAGPGIVARAAEPERWVERTLVPGGDPAQRRIAELEQQLAQLETLRAAAPAGPAPRQESSELETVLARNQELAARNRSLSLENQALLHKQLFESPAASTAACQAPPDAEDPRVQLRYWAERLRQGDAGFRGGLTPEQNAALNVLLRRERPLDPRNPWRGS